MAKKNMKSKKQDNLNNPANNHVQAGNDAGKEILEAAEDAKTDAADALKDTADQVKDAAADAADKAKDAAADVADKAKDAAADAVDAVKDTAADAADKAKDAAADAADKAKDAAADVADKAKDAAADVAAKAEDEAGKPEEKSAAEIKKEREEIEKELKAERKDIKTRTQTIKKMRQDESKQRRTELKNSVVKKTTEFQTGAKEMSEELKGLLTKDIAAMNRLKKTRTAEIVAIFAKHNFYMNGFTPEEMRTTLEDLGPTYVKIGQIMSSRVDMLPENYCKELEKLRQNVKELDPAIARAVIEQETGKKIDEIFSEFNDKPLGSASIGQAHSGVLKDGTKVVTKVQRPLIADMMRNDFVLLKKVASAVNTVKEGSDQEEGAVDLLSVISELEKVTNEELDFRVEAQNTISFKEDCIDQPEKINCPTIYPELTTERILTMSYVDGYSVSDKDKIEKDNLDVNEIGASILENYLHQVLDVGLFHADPHQGNIMISHGIPYWIDFGMIGRLTPGNIKMIQDLILAIIETDTEALVNAGMAMGAASPDTDRAKLTEDLDAMINRYMSVTNLDDLDTAVLLEDVTNIMGNHHIKIPGEYTMLIRSIATIEGVIEQLCPELNLFKMITDKLLARAKDSFNLQQSLLNAGKGAAALGKKAAKIPILASDVLNNLVKGRAKINLELTGYQDLMKEVSNMVQAVVYALFSCVLFFGSCVLCLTDVQPKTSDNIPIMAVVGFIVSIALAIYTVRKLAKKKKK